MDKRLHCIKTMHSDYSETSSLAGTVSRALIPTVIGSKCISTEESVEPLTGPKIF